MLPSGYREIAEILSTDDERVVRAERTTDGKPVVIKMVTPSASAAVKERLHNHIRVGRRLAIPGIPSILESSDTDGGYLVMTDLGHETLADRLRHRSLSVIETITVAHGLAVILRELHESHVLHRDVAPQNITVNPTDHTVGLLDLGIAKTAVDTGESTTPSDSPAGTYAYMAPEQSGRMDRVADSRADLYALGCVMFASLSGHPPFRQTSTAEILHAHAARTAPHIRDVRPDVPEIVDELIDTLLKKDPDDRYQSAAGLAHDLEKILAQLRDGAPRLERLRDSDTSGRFRLPDGVFGRADSVDKICQKARDVRRSGVPIVIIAGAAGVGKSATLARATARLASEGSRVFVGHHQRFRDGQPLVGVLDSYRAVIRSILTRSEIEVDEWREVYRKALGSSAGLFAEAIPELHHLLGDIPASPPLPPAEARTRFLATMDRLAQVIKPGSSPTVFVLEDLQWADDLTFDLLQSITGSEDIQGISLIVTIRTDEEIGEQRLAQLVSQLETVGEAPTVVTLGSIDLRSAAEMVGATLHWTAAAAEPLAQILHTQTHGHPLGIREALLRLHHDGVISFDRVQRVWTCNIQHAASRAFDNLTDLIAERLDMLEPDTKTFLIHAACAGAVFDPDLVISISGIAGDVVFQIVKHLVQESIIYPIGDGQYSFSHDRVHQQSLELRSQPERARIHRSIHAHLLRWLSAEERSGRLFDIVDHGNETIPLLTDRTERHDLARLNLQAAQRSRASAAFPNAVRYLQVVIDLLQADGWTTHREIMLPATLLLGECLSYLRKDREAIALFDEASKRSTEPTERAEAMYFRLGHETTFGDMNTAIDIAVKALAELGIRIPAHPTMAHTIAALAKARLAQGRRGPDAFTTEGNLTDEKVKLALRILDMAASSAFYRSTNMISVVFLTRVTLVFKYGHDEESVDAFSHYGMILTLSGAVKLGAAFGDLAMKLSKQYQNPRTACRAFFVNSATVIHWTRPLTETLRVNRASAEYALEAGDGNYYGFSMGHEIQESMALGISLDEIDTLVDVRWTDVRRLFPLDVAPPLIVSLFYTQAKRFYAGVKGLARIEEDLSGDGFDHEEHVRQMVETRNAAGVAEWYWRLITVCVLSGATTRVPAYVQAMAPYRFAATGQPFSLDLECSIALAHADMIHRDIHPDARAGKREIQAIVKKFKKWQANSPAAIPRYHLVHGLHLVVNGHIEHARATLVEGLNIARSSKDMMRTAQLAEWIGITLERANLVEASRAYHEMAAKAYETQGASVAARRLRGIEPSVVREDHMTSPSVATIHQTSHEVDLDLVLKASAAIAGEIKLDGLIQTLMSLVLQHAGAQRAVLLLHHGTSLAPKAEADVDQGVRILSETAVMGDTDLCVPAVQYADRTQEPLVLNDAMATEPYASDPDIRGRHVRSLMVLPLSHQGKPHGVLYLENRLTSHAFTSERAGVIRLLVGHMAIALENAHLYGQQRATLNAAARFVPSEFLDALGINTIKEVNLGDAVRVPMTVLFADIRRFTTLSETLSVDGTFGFLNDYLKAVTPAIRQHNGFIDKYIGDAIMALYPGDPTDAIKSALEIQRSLTEYNAARSLNHMDAVLVGIGIHTGDVMLGTVGSEDRLDTTVIGDTVNIAARLEELTKQTGSSIIISEDVRSALPKGLVEITEIGVETIRGRSAPLLIHDVKPLA